jgi:Ca-activated chloride channel homolog
MRFAEPWAFLWLLAVPILIALAFRRRSKGRTQTRAAGDAPLMDRLLLRQASSATRSGWQLTLVLVATTLSAIALARPQFGLRTETHVGRGIDIVFALDLSRSMWAQDVTPSRIVRARAELKRMVDKLRGHRIGFVGFTSVALPLCPLTVDHSALVLQIDSAGPDDLPAGGTSMGDAIHEATRMLRASSDRKAAQAIVIITDGENHDQESVAAARTAKEAGIEVNVLGIGSPGGEPIPIMEGEKLIGYVKDKDGNTVVSRLNDSAIREVTEAGGGISSVPGPGGGIDVGPLENHLSGLKQADLKEQTVRIYEERYQWFLWPALLLLWGAGFLRNSRNHPNRTKTWAGILGVGMTLACTQTASAAWFERDNPVVEEGNRALEAHRPDDARKAYQKAKEGNLAKDARLEFNQGLAELEAGELQEATRLLQQAYNTADSAELRASAAYALGNTSLQAKKYKEAIGHYRQALVEQPGHVGAQRNLELSEHIQRTAKALQDQNPDNKDGEPSEDSKQDDSSKSEEKDSESSKSDPQDAGVSDAASNERPAEDGADAGTSGDGGESAPEPSPHDEGALDAGTGESQEEQQANEMEAPEPNASEEPNAPSPGTEALLDALQKQDKALKRQQFLKHSAPRRVEKDW